MKVEVIEPHGFCSGVRAAVEKACHALSAGTPVWCLHELVHNGAVVGELREKGMRFVESPDEKGFLSAGALAGKDSMEISVWGNKDRMLLVARFDNLGKGASGAAIQNMNLALGLPETAGLVL